METLTLPDVTVYLHCAFLLVKMGMAGRVLRDPLLHPRVDSQPAQTSVDTALSFQETWGSVTYLTMTVFSSSTPLVCYSSRVLILCYPQSFFLDTPGNSCSIINNVHGVLLLNT